MDVSRRQFFKICAGGMAGTTVAALGFAPKTALAQARNYKLLRAKEIRNSCTYCSVGCGLLMYSLGDGAKNAKESIYHIEGDQDHPVSRGALCPKGAGLLDYVHSEDRPVSVKVVGTPGLFRLPVFPVLDSALPYLPDASFVFCQTSVQAVALLPFCTPHPDFSTAHRLLHDVADPASHI
ncbi:Molybdopterin oxidoreductase Fe4S4 domain-containing protein [Kosakonia oryziphila]|uniref:Molybdopterin oxidoreductase Fe4S4 domain-containing protein n=1 Tax=Kosakonia oryziphila TaxID=1005667 RepID=A0A1C4GB81_9ENTR|nr:Molybdopterin oxidoreductase Fe4S4 domain-containing protein [Kosakonia oryziphila]